MAVELLIKKTLTGSEVSDVLQGGVTGLFFGNVESGGNTNIQDVYISHDGTQKISELAVYLQSFSQFYGGNDTAGANFNQLMNWGEAGDGLQLSEDAFGADAFNFIFNTSNGFDIESEKQIAASAMVYNNAGTPQAPSAPVAGEIGPIGDSALGDNMHIRLKIVVPSPPGYIGGAIQFDIVWHYQFSS